jgi:hypothetical protein
MMTRKNTMNEIKRSNHLKAVNNMSKDRGTKGTRNNATNNKKKRSLKRWESQ